jgi:hypothetical protein
MNPSLKIIASEAMHGLGSLSLHVKKVENNVKTKTNGFQV